jgi:hypothetical protein
MMLKEYVANGGCLIADCMTASLDELDFAWTTQPGAGLDEVFGARRLDWVAEERPHRSPGNADGLTISFNASVYREILQPMHRRQRFLPPSPTQAHLQPCGMRYGKGEALLLGFSLGPPSMQMKAVHWNPFSTAF